MCGKGVNSIIIVMQLIEGELITLKNGCNSQIMLVRRGELQVVLKAVEVSSTKQIGHLLNEWTVLSQLENANLVDVYHCLKRVTIPKKEGIYYILVQEFAKYGNLSQLVRKYHATLAFEHRRFLFWELALTVDYLHSNDVVHRDLKLDNVLVAEHANGVTIKLADFGFALSLPSSQTLVGSYKGTKRGYMAPQIHACKNDSNLRYDGKASDVFALGVILFALIMGRLPFEFGIPEDRNYKMLIQGDGSQFWVPLAPALTKLEQMEGSMINEFKELFVQMVKYNPKDRMTIGEVMSHPWMLGKKSRLSL